LAAPEAANMNLAKKWQKQGEEIEENPGINDGNLRLYLCAGDLEAWLDSPELRAEIVGVFERHGLFTCGVKVYCRCGYEMKTINDSELRDHLADAVLIALRGEKT
jgi:hypothetical protein